MCNLIAYSINIIVDLVVTRLVLSTGDPSDNAFLNGREQSPATEDSAQPLVNDGSSFLSILTAASFSFSTSRAQAPWGCQSLFEAPVKVVWSLGGPGIKGSLLRLVFQVSTLSFTLPSPWR